MQANDGGFVMSGFSESIDFDITGSRGSYDFWVLKINATGDFVWQTSLGGTGIDISYDIAKTQDNAYVITGNTLSTDADVSHNNGESDVWLVKVNDAGQLVWESNFGGTSFDSAQGIATSVDGGFIISGNSKSMDNDVSDNAGENDIWLIKTDVQGKLIWQKTFGGSNIDFGFDVLENPDKTIIIVGETWSSDFPDVVSKGKSDAVVIKIK